jgi:hypothetical protein
MKIFDFIYFCLYNLSYKDGMPEPPKFQPGMEMESRPVALFTISIWFWIWTIRLLIKHYHPLSIFSKFNIIVELLLFIVIYATFFLYFVNTFRYQRIYQEFRFTNKNIQMRTVNITFVILILPFLLNAGILLSQMKKLS